MGVVTSHEMFMRTVLGRRGRRRASPPPESRPREAVSTGLFRVPVGVGNPITLAVYLSNFSTETQHAQVEIRGKVRGRLVPVLSESVEIPAGQARKVTRGDLAGAIVDVVVTRTSAQLLPSAAVTEFFPADAGVVVHLIRTAGDFVVVPSGS